jgi:hypothetical protein
MRINLDDTGIPGRVSIPFCERSGGIPRTLWACNSHSSFHQLTTVNELPANERLDPYDAEMRHKHLQNWPFTFPTRVRISISSLI